MTAESSPEPVAIRPAATVVLQRRNGGRNEVLMMRRNANAVFVGGHYVFPGGAVDDHDYVVATDASLFAHVEIRAPKMTGNGPDADAATSDVVEHAAYVVAAVREAFEEAGLLLARRPDNSWVDLFDAETKKRFALYRDELNSGAATFADILSAEGLHIESGDLTYWSRWITPIGPPRRFDARFFVAETPFNHEATPDNAELVHAEWVAPADALRRFDAGDFPIIFPTIKTLQSMPHH